jgi:hypothetical protein
VINLLRLDAASIAAAGAPKAVIGIDQNRRIQAIEIVTGNRAHHFALLNAKIAKKNSGVMRASASAW